MGDPTSTAPSQAPTRSKPPRSFGQWALLGVNVVLAGLVVLGGTVVVYGNWRYNGIDRTTIAPGILAPVHAASPVNILLVGSDSRASFTGQDQKSFGDAGAVEGQRSDTMMVVHVDPGSSDIMVLSLPRDLWVRVAGVNVDDKINQAFDGGPSRLIATIEANLGLTIHHFVQVDFSGFRKVVDSIGGVSLFVPFPARDAVTGLAIPVAGCTTLVGEQALAYVRSRGYQEYRDGRWRADPTADLGRIKRQQRFLRQTFRQSVARIGVNPVALDRMLSSVLATVTVDDTFRRAEMLSLARRLRNVNPDDVLTYVLPVYTDVSADKRSILRLSQVEATELLNLFNGFAPGPNASSALKPDREPDTAPRCA